VTAVKSGNRMPQSKTLARWSCGGKANQRHRKMRGVGERTVSKFREVLECGMRLPLLTRYRIHYRFGMHEVAWPHAPVHRVSEAGTYFVTCGTYKKEHHFRGRERCGVVQRGLLQTLQQAGWRLEAWAVFSNHYHFVAHCPTCESAAGLPAMLRTFHAKLGTWVNKLDKVHDRKVWYNFWETRLTFQQSYLARLNYVHQNAVHHGLVPAANQYPWCSASWFERVASVAKVKSIYRFKCDRLSTVDEFEPSADW